MSTSNKNILNKIESLKILSIFRNYQKKHKIYPLSFNSKLDNLKSINYNVYKDYLTQIFKNRRIKNIAITGRYGVGKSSIIRTFEKSNSPRKKYLYISLGSYANDDKKNLPHNSEYINTIEHRLLKQIYARFHQRDLPLSRFSLVNEKSKLLFLNWIPLFFIFLSLLLLLFHETLQKLLKKNIFSCFNDSFHFHIDKWIFAVYFIIFVFLAIAFSCIVMRCLKKMSIKNLSVKSNHAEIQFENNSSAGCLDRYSTEIIYCLEKVRRKIGYTVVFEDIDRLNPAVCIELFTRLKELNHLINERLFFSYIRFIYVVNDEIFSQINATKFFDYCLPIIPDLNPKSAEVVLLKYIREVNDSLSAKLNLSDRDKYFVDVENCDDPNSIIHTVAQYLTDYRLLYSILNDYRLMFELHYRNNTENDETNQNYKSEAEHIFAFAVYKNKYPQDYSLLCSGEDCMLINPEQSCKDKALFDKLSDASNPRINIGSLYYAGFSEKSIIKMRQKMFSTTDDTSKMIHYIQTIRETDRFLITELQELCETEKDIPANVLTEAIRCMIRCKNKSNEWFFRGRKLTECLTVLADLTDSEYQEFIDYNCLQNDLGVYSYCIDIEKAMCTLKFWNERMLQIFCYGAYSLYNSVSLILIDKRTAKVFYDGDTVKYTIL